MEHRHELIELVQAANILSGKRNCKQPSNITHPSLSWDHKTCVVMRPIVQVLDGHENPVSEGEQVKVALDGFEFQDKTGHTRSVSSSHFSTIYNPFTKA